MYESCAVSSCLFNVPIVCFILNQFPKLFSRLIKISILICIFSISTFYHSSDVPAVASPSMLYILDIVLRFAILMFFSVGSPGSVMSLVFRARSAWILEIYDQKYYSQCC